MTIAVDFDDTIHNRQDVDEDFRMGKPFPGAKECLNRWSDEGHDIIIFTLRGKDEKGIKVVEEWLEWFGINYRWVTNIKPDAAVFIDDKAVRFTNWAEMEKLA